MNTSRQSGSGHQTYAILYINAEVPLRGGKETSTQIFLIIPACFLYLITGGLFSRGVWYFENNVWNNIVWRRRIRDRLRAWILRY